MRTLVKTHIQALLEDPGPRVKAGIRFLRITLLEDRSPRVKAGNLTKAGPLTNPSLQNPRSTMRTLVKTSILTMCGPLNKINLQKILLQKPRPFTKVSLQELATMIDKAFLPVLLL